MTRAALKAQAQAEDYPDLDQHIHSEKEQEAQLTLIHEDSARNEIGERPETDIHSSDDIAVRQVLRDITDENYPKADLSFEVQSLSPSKHQIQHEEQDTPKSTRKPRGKAKGRTKKKANTPTVVEPEEEEGTVEQEESGVPESTEEDQINTENLDEVLQQSNKEPQEFEQSSGQEYDEAAVYEGLSEPGPAIEEDAEEQFVADDSTSKTPKFNPALHLPDEEQPKNSEDSFVLAITSRSPSKLGRSQTEPSEASQSVTDSLQALPALRRTSSTNFEESFEALDSLEDTIEQLTAGLPLLRAEEMHSPDSPVKTNRRSVRIDATPSTPKTAATKTPRSTRSKQQSAVKTQDKENTPPIAKTPVSSKTPLKAKTPVTKEATPLKARTPAIRQSSPLKIESLSVKKSRTPAAKAAPEVTSKKPMPTASVAATKATSPTKPVRQSSMMASTTNRPQTMLKKPVSTLQTKPSQRQTSVAPSSNRAEVLSRKSTVPAQLDEKKPHQTSMSFSASPAKQQPNTHQRRVTSGGALSTSKPGFIPAKSSKPPTISTFQLPGEVIAEKLKAQKEAREEKMKQPKLSLAEQKAAKLKADREAREERVRLNQLKAKEEAEEKENRKPQRPVSMSMLTISKARAEAAERGRQASKEWAERALKRRTIEVKTVPMDTV